MAKQKQRTETTEIFRHNPKSRRRKEKSKSKRLNEEVPFLFS
jgi:hypothetical protein